MHILFHFSVSLILSTFYYIFSGNIYSALMFLIGGLVIDIDHVLDCLILHKRFDWIMIADNKNHLLYSDKILLSFHSIEIVLVIFFFASEFAAFALGLLVHMLMDFFYYRKTRQKSILSLSFFYRMSRGFSAQSLC